MNFVHIFPREKPMWPPSRGTNDDLSAESSEGHGFPFPKPISDTLSLARWTGFGQRDSEVPGYAKIWFTGLLYAATARVEPTA
jgi:hypothetical protein